MKGLTKRQREIIDYIDQHVTEKRYNPSYRDIQKHFGFSSLGSVYNHVQLLKKKGILSEETKRARSLKLQTQHLSESIDVPLIGKLRGGMPIETFVQSTHLSVPSYLVRPGQTCYLLRIEGSELEEEWIKEGDLLLVHPTADISDHEMILAQVAGETTLVKRALFEQPYIRLESENPDVQPMILREDHVQILGIILSLIRTY